MTYQIKLKLYNTLTRKKEDFVPIDEKNVRLYVCGPTVYDFAHIGNARPVIVFDVLSRLLRHVYGEKQVTYVRNITDVDDKINARALRDYPELPLNDAIGKVTQKTTEQFHADIKALGCLPPDNEPRATQHIDGMIAMAQTLIDKGHAYVAKGEHGKEVLFDVVAMPNYGGLSNRKLEDQKAGARVEVTSHKKNAGDFVLWKQSDDNMPGWDASFTQNGETHNVRGRPGWHIECSVMSEAHLGKTFDIHGGGLDLIFPHHENEIAQSCCAHGTDKMANIWMHNGYLQVEGKKMSKSVGNFVTINDLLETTKFGGRKWSGEVLRLAMLMTHYREPIDFSIKRLEEAENNLDRLCRRIKAFDFERMGMPDRAVQMSSVEIEKADPAFVSALMNDMNVSEALSILYGIHDDRTVANCLNLMGIDWRSYARGKKRFDFRPTVENNIIDESIIQRLAFINDKNWAEADRIRDELLEQGIQLKDGKDPESGERTTTWEVKR
ncbi:MAG: cysteine--tRNA ligase [Rhizobiales bacterium]|nr:cysteine--tRNA ligase [Hyphomicrobiales bacterium]